MKLIIKEIKKLILQQEFVSVVRDCSKDEIDGIPVHVDNDLCYIQEYATDGIYDGLTVFNTEQIDRIYWNKLYHKQMKKLFKAKPCPLKFDKHDLESFTLSILKNPIVHNMCLHMDNKESNFDVIDKIYQSDEDHILCRALGTKGTMNQYQLIMPWYELTRVSLFSPYQEGLAELFKKID